MRPRTAFAVLPHHILHPTRNYHRYPPTMKWFFIHFLFLHHLRKSSVLFMIATIYFSELKKQEVFIYPFRHPSEKEERTYPFPV